MSIGAILGLLALNAWLLCVGLAVVYGARGWRGPHELVRLGGVAYLAGVAAMGIVWTLQLIVGIRFSVLTILLGGLLVVAVGLFAGRRHSRPASAPRPLSIGVVGALGAAAAIVYLEAQFRAARLAGLYEFDAWSFWVPKAKAIYYFGGLDHQFFRDLPGPSYPPLVPALIAAGCRFIGRPDEVTVHVQFALLLIGFVAALAGLLSTRVHPVLLWSSLLLVLVTPHVVGGAVAPEGDFLLDELFAVGVVLLALWIRDREEGFLPLATLLFAGAVLTKREGIVLVVCAVLAGIAATWKDRPAMLRVAGAGLVAVAAIVPWRIFLAVRDLPGGGPEAGGTGLISNIDRAWPSFRLAVSSLFDFHVWLVVVPLFICAVVVAQALGDRRLVAFSAALALLCLAAFTWSTWAFPSLPVTKEAALNPIVRFTGALVLATAGLIPLLLSQPLEARWRRN
jgi:hypothetical protein